MRLQASAFKCFCLVYGTVLWIGLKAPRKWTSAHYSISYILFENKTNAVSMPLLTFLGHGRDATTQPPKVSCGTSLYEPHNRFRCPRARSAPQRRAKLTQHFAFWSLMGKLDRFPCLKRRAFGPTPFAVSRRVRSGAISLCHRHNISPL